MNANTVKSTPRTITRLRPLAFLSLLAIPLIFTFGCAQKNNTAYRYNPSANPSPYKINQNRVDNIMKTAFSQVGVPYRYGGSSPETGFDCSGYVSWVYKNHGISLPRSSRDMMAVGEPIAKEDLRPGDLVFFNYGYSHVGIYTGDDKYIHSPRTGKTITESSLNGRGRKERFVAARRIINNQGITTISERLKAEWIGQSRQQAQLTLKEKTNRRDTTTLTASSKKTTAKTASQKIKVKNGDTLVTLAKKHKVTVGELVAANRLPNKHKLKLGQTLVIPVKASVTTKTNVAKKSKDDKVAKSTKSNKAASNLTAKAKSSKKTEVKASSSDRKTKAKTAAKSSAKSKTVKKTSAKASKTNVKRR
ncbi:MAG: C40 family peptidase [Deltaproteobacteria bacterium]|nr:C40 family peptidase [Deltaproteobacteria bacterium]